MCDRHFIGWWLLMFSLVTMIPSREPKLRLMTVLLAMIVIIVESCFRDMKESRPLYSYLITMLVQITKIRASLVIATLVHELSHLLAAATTGRFTLRELFSSQNMLGNLPLQRWFLVLCPFFPWPAGDESAHVKLPSEAFGSDFHRIRLAGPISSVIVAAYVCQGNFDPAVSLGFWLAALGGIASDVIMTCSSSTRRSFYCGNFGMLLICAMDRYGINVPDVLREMASITAARGGQSGGLVTLLPDGQSYRYRYVPSKRSDVAKGLINGFFSGLSLRRLFHRSSSEQCRFFLGHTRFATSSKPSEAESHPHRFSAAKNVRIWRCDQNTWGSNIESFEIFVTHNGDFDYWSQFDRVSTHEEVGVWLRKVLAVSHAIPQCDSVKVAGVLELLRTQGIWEHSLRLAFYQCAAVMGLPILQNTPNITAAMSAAADIAESTFESFTRSNTIAGPEDVNALARLLCQKMTAATDRVMIPHIMTSAELIDAFCARAAANFLENDLFAATLQFLRDAQGSFGLTVCCSLDRSKVCIASRGQTMSVSFNPDEGVVLWGSESATQMVGIKQARLPVDARRTRNEHTDDGDSESAEQTNIMRCTYRHDLDEDGGEIIEIAVNSQVEAQAAADRCRIASILASATASGSAPAAGLDSHAQSRFQPFKAAGIFLRVHRQADERMVGKDEFMSSESLISLQGAMVDTPPSSSVSDRVAKDLHDIPRILSLIRNEWRDAKGYNQQTARALFHMIRDQVKERSVDPGGRMEVDILITGAEASLWIGEQLAADLQVLLPCLRVVAISSNKVVGVLSNIRGTAPMAGFAFSALTLSLRRAIIIAISHSGQTFPTLRAAHALRKVCGDRLFVVTGSIDSKMSTAVGQYCYPRAPWVSRVFCTFAGWRPAEALTVSTVACHHTLSELLLFLANQCSREDDVFAKTSGFKMASSDISDIGRLNDSLVYLAAPSIIGVDRKGGTVGNAKAQELRAQGCRWALHILETPHAWCLSTAYIIATIVAGTPLFAAIRDNIFRYDLPPEGQQALKYVTLVLDAVLYSFLPLVFSLILRICQRRPLLARLGKRTIVIGDIPYVHQLLESYVSKLFALSYSVASVDVHGANAVDHLVHRFTHRVVRGTLIAVGRPDGRLFSLVKMESWVLMALQQCKAIVHLLSPPEIVTVGHNPFASSQVVDCHLTLEKKRPDFFCEVLSDVQETAPMVRSASFRAVAKDANIEVELVKQSSKPLCAYSKEDINKRKHSLLCASRLKAWYGEASGVVQRHPAVGDNSDNNNSLQQFLLETSVHGSVHGMKASLHGGSVHGAIGFASDKEVRFDSTMRSALFDVSVRSNPSHRVDSGAISRAPSGAVGPAPSLSEIQDALDTSIRSMVFDTSVRGGKSRAWAPDNFTGDIMQILNRGSAVELWYENRYASLERYMAFLVMFHAMAARVAAFVPLRFDVARSQSQLRVATTAAPISAADLEREWAGPVAAMPPPDHPPQSEATL